MKQFTRKHSKPSSFLSHTKQYCTRRSKNFQRNFLFSFSFKSLELFDSNVLWHFLYQLGINIAHNTHAGHYGKICSRVLANHRACYKFTSSSPIIIRLSVYFFLMYFTYHFPQSKNWDRKKAHHYDRLHHHRLLYRQCYLKSCSSLSPSSTLLIIVLYQCGITRIGKFHLCRPS